MDVKMNIVIIGASGQGKVVLDILQYDSNVTVIGFTDDDPSRQNKVVNGVQVLGNFHSLPQLIQTYGIEGAIVAIGNNRMRASFFEKLKRLKLKLINAIHPSTVISRNVKIGEGVVIAGGAIINTNSKIGNNTIINTGATIDHDNIIGNHVSIQPGANLGGTVTVKDYTQVGIGSTVVQGITIGQGVTVGAGAAVVKDVEDNTVVVGVPARPMNS